jgi:Fur family ferric uptake transcriptional regulator
MITVIVYGMAISSSEWAERAKEALVEAGFRTGGARSAVVELLGRQDCCLSAHEIADRIGRRGDKVGIASVYRALELLHELGLVQRVDLGDGGYRYEPVVPGGEHHHHVVCDRCGRVTPFDDPGLERAIERLGKRLSHAVAAHELVIHGQCPRCERS